MTRRIFPILTCLMLPLLPACTAGPIGGEDGDEGSDTGDPGDCVDPGSPLYEGVPAVGEAPDSDPPIVCSQGWASDAPTLDASWTVPVASSLDGFPPVMLEAHPGGGVVVLTRDRLARFDADGGEMWVETGIGLADQASLHVEEAGTIVISVYSWEGGTNGLTRYGADGSNMGVVPVPFNDPEAQVFGLAGYGEDLLIGAFDMGPDGFWEATLLRVGPGGEELLRKSNPSIGGSPVLAVSDDGVVLFSNAGFLLDVDNGAVLGNLNPSMGGMNWAEADGAGFYTVGNAAGDLSVGRYSSAGGEQWLQTHDRAGAFEAGRALAAGPGAGAVVVGSEAALDAGSVWFGSQPWIVGVDGEGNALWTDRVAVFGEASAAAVDAEGGVYVAGLAELDPGSGSIALELWLRKYEP